MNDRQHLLPVEINGGLSTASIDLRIARAMELTAKNIGAAMDKHTKRVDERFEIHDQKDANRVAKQAAAVDARLDQQDEKLDTILFEVKSSRLQGDAWHAEDLAYRAGVQEWRETQEPKIAKIAEDLLHVQAQQIDISTKFNLLHWLVIFSRSVIRGTDATVAVAERGKRLTGALAAVFSFILLCWQFFRKNGIMAAIAAFWHKHF